MSHNHYEPSGGGFGPRLQDELRRISNAMRDLGAPKKTAAPERPGDGDIVYADGSNWDPGSGEGIYAYYNAQWNKLG